MVMIVLLHLLGQIVPQAGAPRRMRVRRALAGLPHFRKAFSRGGRGELPGVRGNHLV